MHNSESNPQTTKLNPLPDIDFDVTDPDGWYRYVADSLVLTGLAKRSGEAYAREVRILVKCFGQAPYMLSEAEVRRFILDRHTKLNGSSQRILYRGLRFLYNDLFKFDWELLKTVRTKYESIEPTILSREEVARLFRGIKTPHIYAFLRTVYSCGLRLSEALHIRPGDIDRAGGVVHIRQGKGAKDRKVILPSLTLEIFERYWKLHRNPNWLFPALGRDGKGGPTADEPMSISAVQGGMRRYLKRAGVSKSRVTIHSLRHSYATHLLEAGVPLTVLQQQLRTHYFLITFTVPEELTPFFLHEPGAGFTALFKAASGALKTLAANPRFIGADLSGFFAVLHTWGRTLNYHPHIHFVVPGGGIDSKKGIWRSSREDFYAPGQALAEVFKGIF